METALPKTRSARETRAWQQLGDLWFSQKPVMMAICREFDLFPPQIMVLRTLDRPKPMREVADFLSCNSSNLTGITDRLEGYQDLAESIINDVRATPSKTLASGIALTVRTERITNDLVISDLFTLNSVAGSALAVGSPASVVQKAGDQAASAVTVTVTKIKQGSIDDFRFFSLDETTKKSTPYYVTVNVRNEGPAGLGGSALPIYVNDDSNTNLPASDIVGEFKPCQPAALPESFLPGAAANVCLVYLVPEARTLESVIVQTGTTKDAISWKP
jgi:hypothetical protein